MSRGSQRGAGHQCKDKNDGQGEHHQDQVAVDGRHRLFLRDQEELPHHDRKMVKRKYDPVAKKHVEFRETKIK